MHNSDFTGVSLIGPVHNIICCLLIPEIVQSRLSTDNDDLSAQQSELEAENARLHETIAMADKQLTDLRLQTSQMQQDFAEVNTDDPNTHLSDNF